MLDLLFGPYLTNTWAAGTIIALVAGVVGVFVVLRGDTFLAHALPHGSFAGAAVAAAIGASPVAGMGIAALLAGLVISWLGRRRRDVVIALVLTFLLAGGAFVLSLQGRYSNQVYALLFGQVLSVATSDLIAMGILAAAAVVAVLIMARPLLLTAALPQTAAASGLRRGAVETGFTLVVAAATTASVPVVGALLLFSLLVAPPAAACLLCRRPGPAVAAACGLCLLCMWSAIALSVLTDLPVGFFVSAIGALVYVVARVGTMLVGRLGRVDRGRRSRVQVQEAR
jgi:zinc/manganese transport system permease protein